MPTPDDESLLWSDKSGFTFGRNEDPADSDKELRDIAGSLVVNSDDREKACGAYIVRDVSEKTGNKLRNAGFPIMVRKTADGYLSNMREKLLNRLVDGVLKGNPDWNVLRRSDKFTEEELSALYNDVISRAVEQAAEKVYNHIKIKNYTYGDSMEINAGDVKETALLNFEAVLEKMCSIYPRLEFKVISKEIGDERYKITSDAMSCDVGEESEF